MPEHIAICWFRNDLRLADNPALCDAASHGTVVPIFIDDNTGTNPHAIGAASRWWLHHSLNSLRNSLHGKLSIFQGDPLATLITLCEHFKTVSIHWNRGYEPWQIKRDSAIKTELQARGIPVHSHNACLLWEPWHNLKKDQSPYKVFTPFYRRGCLSAPPPRRPLAEPKATYKSTRKGTLCIDALNLRPTIPWDSAFPWQPGEHKAHQRLHDFIEQGIDNYKDGRNFPAKQNVSRLSAHLHWGELSANQFWYEVKKTGDGHNEDCLLSELGWREFAHSLLYHFPTLPECNLQEKFDHFPWQHNQHYLRSWQQGLTGYPIVDAGMRELWQTGYMHNRVRMIVGSFLVKNLLLHWHHGRDWFWDCLVDADLASNSASWQWIAGCGADAAPYFRVFNPITQGEKFDPDGEYTLRYVPELAALPKKYLYKPWLAPSTILEEAGIELGQTYPMPIVDVKESREAALEAFKTLKGL